MVYAIYLPVDNLPLPYKEVPIPLPERGMLATCRSCVSVTPTVPTTCTDASHTHKPHPLCNPNTLNLAKAPPQTTPTLPSQLG